MRTRKYHTARSAIAHIIISAYTWYMTAILNGIIVTLAIGGYTGFFFAILAWRRRDVDGSRSFAIMMLGVAIWALGYALELATPTMSHRIFYTRLQYLGIVTIPGAFLAFAIQYSSSSLETLFQKLIKWALLIHPLITLLFVWAYPYSRLMWQNIVICETCTPQMATYQPGQWFWINVAYGYGTFTVGCIILRRALLETPERNRLQSIALAVAFIAPALGSMLYVSGVRPFGYLDLTPFGFLISATAIGHAFVNFDSLDYAPFAQQRVAETFPDAYFFIDPKGRVVDCNDHAMYFVNINKDEIMAHPVQQVIPGLSFEELDFSSPVNYTEQVAWNGFEVLTIEDVSQQTFDTGAGLEKYYEIKITPMHVRATRGGFVGNLMVFADVTTHLTSHWEAMASNARLEQLVSERTSALESMNLQMRVEIAKRTAMQSDLASRLNELAALHSVGQAVVDRVSQKQVADRAVTAVRQATQTDLVIIYLRVGDHFRVLSIDSLDRQLSANGVLVNQIGEFFCHRICDTGDAVFIDRISADQKNELTGQGPPELLSLAGLPVRIGNDIVGSLVIAVREPREFSAQADFLESMVVEIGLGMHSASLYQESQAQLENLTTEVNERRRVEDQLKKQNLQLTTLNRIAIAMSRELETNRIMHAVLDELIKLPDIDAAWLHTESVENRITLIPSTSMIAPSHIPTLTPTYDDDIKEVLSSGMIRIAPIVLPSQENAQAMALIMVPLIARDDVIGVLAALCRFKQLSLNDCQLLLENAGNQIALGLENLQLHETAAQIEISEGMDRLRADLIANVSHEIRTPLGLIKLFATMMQMKNEDIPPDERKEYLESIEAEVNVLEQLISDLLGLSRHDAGQLALHCEVLDLNEVVADVTDTMHLELANRNLRMNLWSQPILIDGDSFRLQQLVRNLVSNALKYSPDDKSIRISTYVDANDAVIAVVDHGIGIPYDMQPKVFERFFRADNAPFQTRGVGLGLAISKIIAESHGGKMWFDSTPGYGSVFYLSLPLKIT